jgi:soluble lytic murein transglycosylase-like protein
LRRARFLLLLFAPALVVPSAWADCLSQAAAYHRVDARLLRAIALEESGMRPHAVGKNRNGSRDIGLMQINSSWLPALARFGVTETHLYNACINAYVGAWILAHNIARLGLTWEAVGAYNAAAPAKRAAYARRIYRCLLRLRADATVRTTLTNR